ncbi:MATE family efflux transporter [Psychrobacillus vulpis]|uniref:Multidrug export protein MepA n=1 Tax=Psychrobacillus vulpis TaxID=2325572 RepID=A0A544TT46_9BACI|nr:MATE family efflux transporter [Psychrobacillus vulpis]TQR20621.1 MATE family efflux transporter [Psychrobacillus vulpis]
MNKTSVTLRNTPTKKLFISYLIPSLLGMLLMAINILVDGIFVSNGIGPEALAGINIAVPIFSILLSISLWIGMGGATLYSISLGQNNVQKARSIFTQSFFLALIVVGVLVILSLWKQKEVAYLFGASDEIFPYVKDYLHIILVFGVIYVMENILSIFIRNDGNPKLAMLGLGITSLLNIVFNYIFIFMLELGVKGAAYATVLSTAIGLIVLLSHFVRKSSVLRFVKLQFDLKTASEILKIGLPSFIVEGSAAVTIIAYNVTFMHFVGAVGVTSYAVVNYMHAVFIMLFIGIGAALQPIVSFHYGAKLYDRLQQSLKLGVITGVVFGASILLVGWLFGENIISLFGVTSEEVITYTKKGISMFFIGYLFLGFNLVYAEYFQAIKKIKLSSIIIVTRSIILFLPLLWLLPTYLNSDYIWLAFPIAEGVTAICLIVARYTLKALAPLKNTSSPIIES